MAEHEKNCIHPKKTGEEVMSALEVIDAQRQEEQKLYSDIFALLSFEKITFNGKSAIVRNTHQEFSLLFPDKILSTEPLIVVDEIGHADSMIILTLKNIMNINYKIWYC